MAIGPADPAEDKSNTKSGVFAVVVFGALVTVQFVLVPTSWILTCFKMDMPLRSKMHMVLAWTGILHTELAPMCFCVE